MGEIPTMRNTISLDAKRRGTFPDTFKPGDRFAVDMTDADTVQFRRLRPAEVPTVEPRKVKGQWLGAKVTLDRARLAAAIREERDGR